ncbi:AMP-dependent synthetase [Prosthecomicrobium hirschii]|uniref:AMP-binding protein n=1 Tax=Prosthecodimorpha hirschii TaxID=665126 RepID=UPI00112D0065|nr:AMP-binding protein [Prosthecomicrobium hirschii]TPQ51344.1 AMP-dependent synthetase [Prosthecomicrobium hirschii]
MNIAGWLAGAGRSDPSLPAVGHGTRVVATYGQLAEATARLAGGLAGLGVRPGDRVAIIAKNEPDYVAALHAVWWAGAAAVPVNAKLHPHEFAYALENSGAAVAFVSAGLESAVAATAPAGLKHLVPLGGALHARLAAAEPLALVERPDDALAWLFYTSGTTGRPKGAMLSHGNLSAMTHAYLAEVDPTAPGDRLLHAAPMSHGSGLYMMAHVVRRAVNVVPESGGFEPDELYALAAHWRRVSLFAAPTMVKRMVGGLGSGDPTALRTVVYGGGPMYAADAVEALDALGPCLAQIYGQGETPMTISTLRRDMVADRDHPDWLARLASVGQPFGIVEVRVADAGDVPLPVGETGEVLVRGPTVMSGYWDNPDASMRTLAGGWLHTGDQGAFAADGLLTLKDRSKDVIISGGSNIYPREVEEVLLRHPGLTEVSVIGRADPEWGEIVVAYAVGAATPEALDALCLDHIARFKRPKHYVFVEALPKNNYGKILKTDLRALDRKIAGPQ